MGRGRGSVIRGVVATVALAVGVTATGVVVGPTAAVVEAQVVPPSDPPNIVVIMTDDQTLESLRVMDRTRSLIGDEGTTFTNAVVSYPECCPSRASFLTGQYSHNHRVLSSMLPTGGVAKLASAETLPVWLDRAGYWTSFTGKYLNGYGKDVPAAVPPGWDSWWGLVDPSTYQFYGYTISKDGVPETYGSTEADYSTDVLGAHVVEQIRSRQGQPDPFFIWFTPVAPHSGTLNGSGPGYPYPAPRHRFAMAGEQVPRTAGFNELDVSDKPAAIQSLPLLTPTQITNRDRYYQMELEGLLGIDEWVGAIHAALDEIGELDNTIIVFTSDHGYMHGEHRIPYGKPRPYEENLRVPLLIRGPGFPAGVTRSQQVANIDLAPTLAAAGGATPGVTVDGTALQPMAASGTAGPDRSILITSGPLMGRATFVGLRGTRYKYVEHSTGERELYDLQTDPYETRNNAGKPSWAAIEQALATRLATLRTCRGAACLQR